MLCLDGSTVNNTTAASADEEDGQSFEDFTAAYTTNGTNSAGAM